MTMCCALGGAAGGGRESQTSLLELGAVGAGKKVGLHGVFVSSVHRHYTSKISKPNDMLAAPLRLNVLFIELVILMIQKVEKSSS